MVTYEVQAWVSEEAKGMGTTCEWNAWEKTEADTGLTPGVNRLMQVRPPNYEDRTQTLLGLLGELRRERPPMTKGHAPGPNMGTE